MFQSSSLNFKKIIFAIILFLISAILMFSFFVELFRFKSNKNIWLENVFMDVKITLNGKPYEHDNQKNSSFKMSKSKRGDVCTLEEIIPYYSTNDSASLVFYSNCCAIQVLIDDTISYTYGMSLLHKKVDITSQYHVVPLDKNDVGKKLTIKLYAADNGSLIVPELRICLDSEAYFYIFQPLAVPISLNLALMIMGVLGLLASFVSAIIGEGKCLDVIGVSGFSLFIGMWSNANYGFFQFFHDSAAFGNILEYGSCYMSFLFYLILLSGNVVSKYAQSLFKALKIVCGLFIAFVFISNYLNLIHLSEFLRFFHVLIIIVFIISAVTFRREYKKQEDYQKLISMGQIVFSSVIILQLIVFNLLHIFNIASYYDYNLIGTLSMLVLIVFFLVGTILRWYHTIEKDKEYTILKKMAYNDALTGLNNRQSSIISLLSLEDNNIPYYCIAFDLNNLKKANDTFGHERGDLLLKDFADSLQQTFTSPCSVYRIGGDEFLAITPDYGLSDVNKMIKSLHAKINEINLERNDGINLETAYGIAYSEEVASSLYEDILKLADDRMYANKKTMKGARP